MHIVANTFNSATPYFVSHTPYLDHAPFPTDYIEMTSLTQAVDIGSSALGFGDSPSLEGDVIVYKTSYEIGSPVEFPMPDNKPNTIILRNKTYPEAREGDTFFKRRRGGVDLTATITFGKFIRLENEMDGVTREGDTNTLVVELPMGGSEVSFNFLLNLNELNRAAPKDGTQDVQNEINIEISYNKSTNRLILVEE